MGRRAFLRFALLALAFAPASLLADQEVAVPVALQTELLMKVVAYDKNLPSRLQQGAKVLILTRAGNPIAVRVAQQAARALEGKSVGGRAIVASQLSFGSAKDLTKRVKDEGIAIVYVTPGFEVPELQGIASALEGLNVLSAGAVAGFVRDGVVLSFDLVGGKPKLLVNLKRAKSQNVELSSQVLKLMKVVE